MASISLMSDSKEVRFGSVAGADSVRRVSVWRPVILLEFDRRTKKWRKKPSSLIYDPSSKGGSGVIYWCERGRREQANERAIDIDSIISFAFGREAARHSSGVIAAVNDKTAFSITTKNQVWHCFEEENEEMRAMWLEALRHVLGHTPSAIAGGVTIKMDDFDEKARSGTFVVTRKKTAKEMALTLTNGRHITRHHGGDGFSTYVFYKGLGLGKLGTMYWCEPGEHDEIADQSIALGDISEILVGRQSKEFANYASAEACISLISKNRSLHLEELSADDAQEFLATIQALLSAAGAMILGDPDMAARLTVTQPPKSAATAALATSSRKKTPARSSSSSSVVQSTSPTQNGPLGGGGTGGTGGTGTANNFSGITGSVKRHASPSSALRRVPSPSPSSTLSSSSSSLSLSSSNNGNNTVRSASPPRYPSTKRNPSPPPRRPGGLRKSTGVASSVSSSTSISSSSIGSSSTSLSNTATLNRKVGFNSSVTVKKMPSSSKAAQNSAAKKDNIDNAANNSSDGHHHTNIPIDHHSDNNGANDDNDDNDNDNDDDDELRATPRDDSTTINSSNDITTIPLSDGPSSRHDTATGSPPSHTRRVNGSSASAPAVVIRVLPDDDDRPQTYTSDQAVRMLRQGREVNLYDGNTGLKRVVMAWYEPPVIGHDGLGSFYWTFSATSAAAAARNNNSSNGGTTRDILQDQSLPLASLTDMILGKDHLEFRRMASALYAPANCCFSLVTANGSWHIHETSSWRADAWIEAVQYLLRSATTLVITEQQAMEERSRSYASSSSSSSFSHARKYSFARRPSTLSDGLAAVQSMCRGREANWWQANGCRRVFLFYVPRHGELGTLYWCATGERQQVTGQQLPLSTLIDISHGRRTRVLMTPNVLARTTELQCFSLITNDGILDLEEDSEDGAWLWMQGLQHILEHAGNDAHLYDPSSSSSSSSLAPSSSSSSSSSISRASISEPSTPRAQQKAAQLAEMLKSIKNGRIVTLWDTNGANEVFMCYRSDTYPGSLYWLPVGTIDQATDGKRLPLAELTAVTVGKAGGHLKQVMNNDNIRDDCCFSLIARSRTLDIQDKTATLAAEWVRSLHHILLQAGAAVTPARNANGTSSTPRTSFNGGSKSSRPSVNGAALPMTSLSAEEAINRMVAGRRVTRFDRSGEHADIFLFYQAASSKGVLGSLYWVDPDQAKEASLTRSFALSSVTDLYIGLHTPTLKAAATAAGGQSERCLSLVGRNGMTLDIMESSGEHALMWFDAIRTVLSGGGADLTAESQGSDRRLSLARPSLAASSQAWVRTPAEAMKLLQAGRNVILYEPGVVAGAEAFVFLTTFADSHNPGALYWCPRGLREENKDRSFNLADLQEIYTGRQTSVFKSSAAIDAQPQACFSLLFNGLRALHIEEESRDRLPLWLDSIHQLLSLLHRRVVIDDAWPTADDRGRHFLIETVAPRLSVSNSANFKLMREGRDWLLYTSESKAPTPIFLFYNRDSTRHGSLYWCAQGTRDLDASCSLALHAVTDIYVGKDTSLFRGEAARDAREDRCVTLVANDVSLALEAQSAAYLAAWLPALDQLLQTFGRMQPTPSDDVLLSDNNTPLSPTLTTPASGGGFAAALGIASVTQVVKGDVRRYSIAQYQLPGELPASPGELLKQASEGHAAFLAVNPRSTIAMMERGQEFGRYTSFKSERVLLYYKSHDTINSSNSAGSVAAPATTTTATSTATAGGWLYWSDNLKKDDRPQNRMGISEITEVRLGKDTSAFTSPWAHYAEKSTCLSLISASNTLDIEAKSVTLLGAWLFGISTLLTQAGFGVRLLTSSRAPDAFDGNEKKGAMVDEERRFIVERRSDEQKAEREADEQVARDTQLLPAELRQAPRALLSQLSRRRKTLEALSPDSVISMMKKGRVFTGYALSRRGEFTTRRLCVFYTPGDISTSASSLSSSINGGHDDINDVPQGCLHWCTIGQRLESPHFSLPLAKVRELQLGKQSPAFQHAGAANAIEDRCVTIVGVGISLDLEARSSDQLSAWLFGINTLLGYAGREAFSREEDTADVEGRMLAASIGLDFITGERAVTAPTPSTNEDFRRRFSVRASSPLQLGQLYALPSLILEPTAPALMKQVWARRKTFVALSPAEAVRMMVTGCNFNMYTDAGVLPIFLFYSPSTDGGALFWCDQPTLPTTPVVRVESMERRLLLRDIAEIVLGKRGPLTQVAANAARANRCFVLIGTPHSLHLEAETPQHVNAWLFGVNRVLAALPGRRAHVEPPAAHHTIMAESKR